MYAVKTMTLEMAELTRRCDAARGSFPLPAPTPRSRLQRALLVALAVAGLFLAGLVGLLFASAILDF